MQIDKFDKIAYANITHAISLALKEVGDRFGVDFRPNGGQTGVSQGRIDLQVNVRKPSDGLRPGEKKFRIDAGYFGLPNEAFHTILTHKGRRFRVVGLNSNAPVYPVECEALSGGRGCRFPIHTLRNALEMAKVAKAA
ncbi:hypothetical protein [Phyllobacterium myrsinacearum]|uniref:Uncharacterized protein n=1 Tax=Phyllobacterium myrsinacearum TaxID=28101 RepID=A0A839ENI5_9HYPH|nr:hypothetical protein [Phyllobacterium myrsinacearum]MBA8881651.1 hypothetical protein [Phyllobacterium myrsinacearum]